MNNPSRGGWIGWLLAASLVLNAYLYFSPRKGSDPVLATAGHETFRRSGLSENARKNLASLENAEQLILKKEAENWAENLILPKEAQSRGKTVQELLEQEISGKITVGADEVERRLALSPAADRLPYPQVLKEVENDLRSVRSQAAKKAFLESLYSKYRAEIKPRVSAQVSASVPTRFPVYEPPANGSPSKGPSDAPVTIEIYSDFMCPYSAKFSKTMAEVEKQYPGKVRTIFHQFPLPFHEGAHLMSQAALCAGEQGKFWEFHDRLMGQPKGKIEKGGLLQIAEQLGLQVSPFQACLDGGKKAAQVDQNIAMGRSAGVSGTPGYRINGRSGFGAVPFETLKPLIDWCLKPQGQYPGNQKKSAPAAPVAPGNQLDPAKTYALPSEWLEKGPSRGPKNAPVTVVEFTDYHCPFCQRGAATVDGLMAKYKDKVRHVSKQFPLPMHPDAMKAAVGALCADEQGKYWEYRAELFGASWGKKSVEDLKAAAKKIGLNENAFNGCLDQDKTKDRVNEDRMTASGLGARGMPTYFINGTPLVGAQPVENFEKVIEGKLGEKKR